MTREFRVALSLSVSLHAAVVVGLPVAEPVAFDVERAPTSVELYLAQPAPPTVLTPHPAEAQAERPRAPEEVMTEAQEPPPRALISQEQRGAITEALPSYLRNQPPFYPRLARERREQGTVLLEVEVLPSGRCGTMNVLASSGHALLDQAALSAVRGWVFRPARRWNHAVSFWVEIPITFRLVDGDGAVEPMQSAS